MPKLRIPQEFLCPISGKLMKEPVIYARDGKTYERNEILKRLPKEPESYFPFHLFNTKSDPLTPNSTIKTNIQEFTIRYPLPSLERFWQCLEANSEDSILTLNYLESYLHANDKDGTTSLHKAAKSGHKKVVEEFLGEGCDVNSKDFKGNTALHLAVQNKHYEVTASLLQSPKINVNELNNRQVGYAPLHIAVSNQDHETVSVLLKHQNIDVNIQSTGSNTALHVAILNEDLQTVVLLLKHKNIDLNTTDWRLKTPLHLAAETGFIEKVREKEGSLPLAVRQEFIEILISLAIKTPINARDRDGRTALHHALRDSHLETVSILLLAPNIELGAKDNYGETPLHIATENGLSDIVKCLLNDSVNTQVPDKLQLALDKEVKNFIQKAVPPKEEYFTSTRLVSHYNQTRLTIPESDFLPANRMLDINSVNDAGVTSLHYAVVRNHIDIARLLLGAGANVNVRDKHENTPLELAILLDRREIKCMLLAAANHKDQPLALHYAVFFSDLEAIKLLLASKANVNAEARDDGTTPLHIAAIQGNLEATKLLLESNADVNARRNEGKTALHYVITRENDLINAQEEIRNSSLYPYFSPFSEIPPFTPQAFVMNKLEVVKLLLTKNADVNAREDKGLTPLHLAAANNEPDIVAILLANGADYKALNKENQTPLQVATAHEHSTVAELIKTHHQRLKLARDQALIKVAKLEENISQLQQLVFSLVSRVAVETPSRLNRLEEAAQKNSRSNIAHMEITDELQEKTEQLATQLESTVFKFQTIDSQVQQLVRLSSLHSASNSTKSHQKNLQKVRGGSEEEQKISKPRSFSI